MNILTQFFESAKRKKKKQKPANLEVYIQQKISFQSKMKLRTFFPPDNESWENFSLPHLPQLPEKFLHSKLKEMMPERNSNLHTGMK